MINRVIEADLLRVDIGNGCVINLSDSIADVEKALIQAVPLMFSTAWDESLRGKVSRGWRYAIGGKSIAVANECIRVMSKPIWRMDELTPGKICRFLICVAAMKRVMGNRELIDYGEHGKSFVRQSTNLDVDAEHNPLGTDLLVWDKWGRGWYCPQLEENKNVYFNVSTLVVSGFLGKDNIEFHTLSMFDAFKHLVDRGNHVASMVRFIQSLPPVCPSQTELDDAYEEQNRSYILQAGVILKGVSMEDMVAHLEEHDFSLPCPNQRLSHTERRKLVYFIVNLSLEGFE